MKDKIDLSRFLEAHSQSFSTALSEIRNQKKISHWMWFIFPQIKGLGYSGMSQHFAITNLAEAKAFAAHPILGKNLKLICEVVLSIEQKSASDIFGSPDDKKLFSSMTLFSLAGSDNIFNQVLIKFFEGKCDARTIKLLSKGQ